MISIHWESEKIACVYASMLKKKKKNTYCRKLRYLMNDILTLTMKNYCMVVS